MAPKIEFQLHIQGPDMTREFTVPVGTTTIGRDPGCELQLVFPLISRRHAQLICTDTGCEIVDLESANGTKLNGEKLPPNVPVGLADGSLISIGPFEITCKAAPVEAPAAEAEPASVAPVEPPEEAPRPAVPSAEEEEPARPPKKATKPAARKAPSPPAEPPPETPTAPPPVEPAGEKPVPVGLSSHSVRLLEFLPGIYHTDFMSRFLALFEATLLPIEWNVDNFHLYLDPGTAPIDFLPWLGNWYTIMFDSTWNEVQRRALLKEAHRIYARRGTRWALSRVLEIYTGVKPEIIEFADEKEPFTFTVKIPAGKGKLDQELIENIIDASKPAHATYKLVFQGG